jgi:hypothetical protein
VLLTAAPAGGGSVVRLDEDNERRPITVMMCARATTLDTHSAHGSLMRLARSIGGGAPLNASRGTRPWCPHRRRARLDRSRG